VANNILLYNAALNGFISGALAGAYQVDPIQADYTAIVSQAVVFAAAMDAAVPLDWGFGPQPPGTIEISNPDSTARTAAANSAQVEAQTIKPQLMQALCFGFAFQRYITGLPSTTFTRGIAAIKAVYFQTLLSGLYT